jgi:polysaccharide pyruvyl transferase WcaK-like protein
VIQKVAGASLAKKDARIDALSERLRTKEKARAKSAAKLAASNEQIKRLRATVSDLKKERAEQKAQFRAAYKEKDASWAARLKEATATSTRESIARQAAALDGFIRTLERHAQDAASTKRSAELAGQSSASDSGDAVDLAIADAEALAFDANYDAALGRLTEVAQIPGVLQHTDYIFLLARLLKATGQYEAATDALQLAHRDATTASRASAYEAQIAWIQHDYAHGLESASFALRANPANRFARRVLTRLRKPCTPPQPQIQSNGIAHAAFYVKQDGNFGDLVLPEAVRQAFEHTAGPTDWLPIHVHQVFDQERLELVNAQRAMIVGGGGLFLPDTAPNRSSGWQWNVSREMLERIDVPLAAFAVGYNLFPGQKFQGDLFRSNLVAFAEKAVFLGLRNHGSIDRVRAMLPTNLHDKVRFVPCPTTILQHIQPGLADSEVGSGRVLINAAFDRSSRRFHEGYEGFLEEMAKFISTIEGSGAEIRFASHLAGDEQFVHDLDQRFGRRLPVDALNRMPPNESFEIYRRASLVIGMRGHATMIPFGLGTPVLSIVSHPKMRYFLDDVGRTEWAFDVDAPGLGAALALRADDVLGNEEAYRADVAQLQLPLRDKVASATRDLLAAT